MLVAYLDTNHLSMLARFPERPDAQAVLRALHPGGYHLGISWLHLHELSDPRFVSRPAVGALLDDVPVAWAPSPDELLRREVIWAIDRAHDRAVSAPEAFVASFEQATGSPPEANIPISQMLEAMTEHPRLRGHLKEAAAHGVRGDRQLKSAAAVVRSPDEPLIAHIRDVCRGADGGAECHLTPEVIFEHAGGAEAFPAHHVSHSLARTRLKDESFPTEESDLIDEWHATYAPYCAAIALDRRTVARFRSARLPWVSRVHNNLGDLGYALRIV